MLRLHAAALAILALLAAGPAEALSLEIDPLIGGGGSFFWDLTVDDSVRFGPPPAPGSSPFPYDTLTITLERDRIFSFFAVRDEASIGDSFDLFICPETEPDCSKTGWTFPASYDGTDRFEARLLDFSLSAGTYIIDLRVVTTAPGHTGSGAGSWWMSPAIPEPSSAILACVGALVLGGALRRRRAGS